MSLGSPDICDVKMKSLPTKVEKHHFKGTRKQKRIPEFPYVNHKANVSFLLFLGEGRMISLHL